MTTNVFSRIPGLGKRRRNPTDDPATLRGRAMRGTAWTLGSYLITQGLRLTSNLILAWLLFPEAFGLMRVVALVITGLQLFSDLGIGVNIVQHDNSEDPKFLHTAMTLQAFRGTALFLGTCLLGFPAALFYNEWQLVDLLAISGFSALIAGFNSPCLHLIKRKIALRKFTTIEITSKIVSTTSMVGIALVWPTVYCLPIGTVIGALYKLILTHTIVPGPKMHFAWDKPSVKELIGFGKWVLLSSFISFWATQGDKLFMGWWIGMTLFGTFSIALMFATLPTMLVRRVAQDVLFPVLAELRREKPDRVRHKLRKARIMLLIPTVSLTALMVFFGPMMIGLLYPDDFADAGWMLSILAFDPLVTILTLSYSRALLAYGRSKDTAFVLAIEAVIRLVGLYLGHRIAGVEGLIASLPISSCLIYPIMAYRVSRIKLLQLDIDLLTIGIGSIIAAAALFVF